MIKLSVITPTYNRVGSLRQNIRAVLSQKFAELEHIIVDNLSNDGTEELVRDYILRAPYKEVYIREKDKGIFDAMNKGIQKAKGEWIHILNDDDVYFSSQSLRNIFLKKYRKIDMLASGVVVIEHGKKISWIAEYKKRVNHYFFPHQGIIIKRDFYKRYGLYDLDFEPISDSVFNCRNFNKSRYVIIRTPLAVMSGGGGCRTDHHGELFI